MLEQGTFFNRRADYIFMLAFGAVVLLVRLNYCSIWLKINIKLSASYLPISLT